MAGYETATTGKSGLQPSHGAEEKEVSDGTEDILPSGSQAPGAQPSVMPLRRKRQIALLVVIIVSASIPVLAMTLILAR